MDLFLTFLILSFTELSQCGGFVLEANVMPYSEFLSVYVVDYSAAEFIIFNIYIRMNTTQL